MAEQCSGCCRSYSSDLIVKHLVLEPDILSITLDLSVFITSLYIMQ